MEPRINFAITAADRLAYCQRQAENYMLTRPERAEWASEARSLERQEALRLAGIGFIRRARLLGRAVGRHTA